MRSTGALAGAALALALVVVPGAAAAQSKQACADAYVAGQVARKEGLLREARARFEVCASASCPAALQRDCGPWRGQLDREIPTLDVTVTDAAGAPVPGAAVTVDGAPLAASSTFDPGEHAVHVEAPGLAPIDQRVTLAAGERGRQITVRLGGSAGGGTASAGGAARPVPIGPIVLGAAGVVALGVFAGLGVAGNAKKSSLDALGCKPDCSPSAVSAARSLYLGADVALGLGLGALVTAGVLLIVHFNGPAPAAGATGFVPSRGALTVQF